MIFDANSREKSDFLQSKISVFGAAQEFERFGSYIALKPPNLF